MHPGMCSVGGPCLSGCWLGEAMQSTETWEETKFTQSSDGSWIANPAHVPITSRITADLAARWYAAAIEAHARGDLADLGCGRVPLYALYRERVRSVTCIDWPNTLHGARHVDLFADLNEPLHGLGTSFDTVIASDVIEHLHTPTALFASAARLLRPRGILIVGVPFLYWVHEQPHDHHRYTEFSLVRMVDKVGLEMVSLDAWGGGPEVVADLLCKMAGHGWQGRLVYRAMAWALCRTRVRRLSASTKRTMPLGYLLVARKPGA